MSKVVLAAKIKVHPGKRNELLKLFAEHLGPRARANDAQEIVLFCNDSEDPDSVHIIEVYSGPEAAANNAAAPWFGEYMREAMPLLAAQPQMERAEPVWAKGLDG